MREGPAPPTLGCVTELLRQRRPAAFDALVAVALFGLGLRGWAFGRGHTTVEMAGLAAVMCTALLWRRRRPTLVFLVVAAAALVQFLLMIRPQTADLPLLVATYSVAAYGDAQPALFALGAGVLGALLVAVKWANSDHRLLAFVAGSGAVAALWAFGQSVRNRRAYLAGLEERAAQLESERDAHAAIVAAAERARIARELHDVVAHSLAVMITQADGAEYALGDSPEKARSALATIASTGRGALAEMRRLLGVLRSDESISRSPQPDARALPALVEQMRQAGLDVEFCAVDVDRLPEGLSLTVYRVVQEALTNTLKHAGPGTRASVEVTLDRDGVALSVVDNGRTASAQPDPGGHGLAGMRERAALYGGSVTAGPVQAGGWRVDVVLREPVPV